MFLFEPQEFLFFAAIRNEEGQIHAVIVITFFLTGVK